MTRHSLPLNEQARACFDAMLAATPEGIPGNASHVSDMHFRSKRCSKCRLEMILVATAEHQPELRDEVNRRLRGPADHS